MINILAGLRFSDLPGLCCFTAVRVCSKVDEHDISVLSGCFCMGVLEECLCGKVTKFHSLSMRVARWPMFACGRSFSEEWVDDVLEGAWSGVA